MHIDSAMNLHSDISHKKRKIDIEKENNRLLIDNDDIINNIINESFLHDENDNINITHQENETTTNLENNLINVEANNTISRFNSIIKKIILMNRYSC